jgi:hypothetical protein
MPVSARAFIGAACLYRAAEPDGMTATALWLTRDRRFLWSVRAIGLESQSLEAWTAERARRFLLDHGEDDVVEQFPDLFRRTASPPAPPRRKAATAPRSRPAEPYLFPLH